MQMYSLCQTIKGLINDDFTLDKILIPDVNYCILAKVIELNRKNVEPKHADENN